jgi:ATP-dependent Lhr-like helicase
MSTLASSGEMRPAALAAAVLKLSSFSRVTKEDYLCLLKHLLATGQLQRTEEGGLIVGLNGERQINSFKFYAVFKDSEEYSVRNASQELGTIVQPPPPGEKVAIAGHVWLVEEVDHKRRQVYVQPVKGQVPAFFGLCPGDIHTKILEQMKSILLEDASYSYVKKAAAQRLEEARESARNSGMLSRPLIHLGGNMWCLFPWLGTYSFLALEGLIKLKCAPELGISGVEVSRPYFMQFKMKASKQDFYRVLKREAAKEFDPLELIYNNELPLFDKYDEFLPPELVSKGFACSVLDISGMKKRINEW